MNGPKEKLILVPPPRLGDTVLLEPIVRALLLKGISVKVKSPYQDIFAHQGYPLVSEEEAKLIILNCRGEPVNRVVQYTNDLMSRGYSFRVITQCPHIDNIRPLLLDGGPYIGLIHGVRDKANQWPYWALLAKALVKEYEIHAFDLDIPLGVGIDHTGLSLTDLMQWLKSMRMVVANDTGPAHLAAAVGVPTIVITNNFLLYQPYGKIVRCITSPYRIRCISVRKVYRYIIQALSGEFASQLPALYVIPGTYGDVFLSKSIIAAIAQKYKCKVDVMTRNIYFAMLEGDTHIGKLICYPYRDSVHPDIICSRWGSFYHQIFTPYFGLQCKGQEYLDRLIQGKRQFALDYASQCGILDSEIKPISLSMKLCEIPSAPYIISQTESPLSSKNWKFFKELYSRIRNIFPEIKIVQVGSATALRYDETIPFIDREWGEVSYLVHHARLYVGVDSVIAHISAVARIPTITLFGGTDANVSAGWGDTVVPIVPQYPILDGKYTCTVACHAACYQKIKCIDTISVDRVLMEVIRCLKPKI